MFFVRLQITPGLDISMEWGYILRRGAELIFSACNCLAINIGTGKSVSVILMGQEPGIGALNVDSVLII